MRLEIFINPQQFLLGINYYTETNEEAEFRVLEVFLLLFTFAFETRHKL